MLAIAPLMLLTLLAAGDPAVRHWHDVDENGTYWQLRDDEDDQDAAARGEGCLFEPNDLRVLTHHYGRRARALPPGLEKKLYRTGQLPPGWERKIKPLPLGTEMRLAPLPHDYRRGYIDGYAIVYDPATQMIVDIAVVF
jgi:hypothetical protein